MGHRSFKPDANADEATATLAAANSASPKRNAMQQVRATAVLAASEAAIAAFAAAREDWKRVHEQEWGSDRDTLFEIEMLDDRLQGVASWVRSGRPHPEPERLLRELEQSRRALKLDLRLCLPRANFSQAWVYLNNLADLLEAEVEYLNSVVTLQSAG